MASSSSSSSNSAPSSSSRSWKYDVFLSFRGEDTRKTFVDHLYSALVQRLIRVYKDDEALPRGDSIGPSLLEAIEESRIAVVVFSKNYADSSWCLDELAYIMKCKDEKGLIVMPLFYDVDPSQVRKQQGDFGKAFSKQEAKNINKVEAWRKALVDASNIAGWEHKNIANGHETKVIKEIVDKIQDRLFPLDSDVDEDLVGMRERSRDLISQLEIGRGGVHMVGIWGIGGSGKTTLASSVYMQISLHFPGHCFVANIREASSKDGLETLQQKILSTVLKTQVEVQSVEIGKHIMKSRLCNSKVLVVLDDVNDLDQLEALVGSHKWFGSGSRIIITTRDEHLLRTHRVDHVTPIRLLSDKEALQLFSKHAYNEKEPLAEHETLSLNVVSYAAGLPLALKVLGSSLFDKDKNEWISALAKLKDIPNIKIMDILKISYDGLESLQKELFLDIACFFRWKSIDDAMEILEACGFHPVIEIKVLRQKALIITTDGKFDMHDLVQEMGQHIVRGEHPYNPENHSRVWKNEEINNMCYGVSTKENDKIEAMRYYGHSSRLFEFLSNLRKLRWLSVVLYLGDDMGKHTEGPSYLSNELRYLYWERYPASPFPDSFQPMNLVVLKLHYSLQKELWNGCKCLPHLKVLQLCFMSNLLSTPDFNGLPHLQTLKIFHCDQLEEIHPSHGNHASLEYVSVRFCKKLRMFPMNVQMKNLKILELPKIQSKPSGECYTQLETVVHQFTRKMNLGSLQKLDLCGWGLKDGEIPSGIGELSNLEELNLSHNDFSLLGFSLSKLTRLKILLLSKCKWLVELPELPSRIAVLKADYCDSIITIGNNRHTNFKCLCEVSFLRNSRGIGNAAGGFFVESMLQCTRKMNLGSLQKLDLCGWGLKDGEIPSVIGELSNLEKLNLSHNDFSLLGFSLSKLTRLKILFLSKCKWLVELPELPSRIAVLKADYCDSLITIGNNCHTNFKCLCEVSFMRESRGIGNAAGGFFLESMLQCTRKMNPRSLQKLDLSSWHLKDGEIPSGIGELSNLEKLDLSHNDFSLLGFSLSKLIRLKILLLSNCKRLVELPELPSRIAVLKADYCHSLITIGNNRHTNFKCLCEVSFKRKSRGIGNVAAGFFVETMLQCTRKMNLSSLQKLNLSRWGLKDGEIPSGIGELFNLEELNLSENDFSLLGFSLSKLTRLKILLLSFCKWLVELPELPSSIVVLKADYCDLLITIGNNCHTNFKCLCEVSFLRDSRGIVNDAGRLVESMLQGMGIPKPYLGRWEKCKVQLPENWCYDFCGFIMCPVRTDYYPCSIIINIEKVMNDITSSNSEDDVDDVSFEKSIGGGRTRTGFVSFASLRHTSWWQWRNLNKKFRGAGESLRGPVM